jgi:hypothetical protein
MTVATDHGIGMTGVRADNSCGCHSLRCPTRAISNLTPSPILFLCQDNESWPASSRPSWRARRPGVRGDRVIIECKCAGRQRWPVAIDIESTASKFELC